MEFGKVPEAELAHIDLRLPPDPQETTDVLKKSKGKSKTKFYIGCAKWGRKDWIGKFYPPGTKEKDFLEYYARLFNSIELNTTYYKIPTAAQVQQWKSKVGKDFKFCPKFTDVITHMKRLQDTRPLVDSFLEGIHAFGENLGPVFLMPHPQMGPKYIKVIEHFLDELPKDVEVFLELRHPDWYTEGGYNKELLQFLQTQKRGTIITDAAGRRDCVHMHLSTPEAFIRFVGNALHPSDYTRVDEWVARIGTWMHEGLKTCYFFMHQHEELHSPELIHYFMEQMNKHYDLKLKPPMQVPPDNTLF
jgi:uncharacterized protein YecE (DUF72 family)